MQFLHGKGITCRIPEKTSMDSATKLMNCIPFFTCSNTSHAVQFVQNSLQTDQDLTIKCDGKRPFESRLVLRLSEQSLEFNEFYLQM